MSLKDWIIPLFTVLVVILQSLFSLVSKWIDVSQKKDDHRQELRKIYFQRKLEVGEAVIGRWVLLMRHMRAVRDFYATYRVDKEEMDSASTEAFAKHNQFDREQLDGIFASEKNPFLTYFDEGILTDAQVKIADEYNANKLKIRGLIRKRIRIDYLDPNEEDPLVLVSGVSKEYSEALKALVASHDKYVRVLKEACAAIRKELNP